MNNRHLVFLGVVVALLLGAYVVADRSANRDEMHVERTLFSDIDAEQIRKITIEQGADRLELSRNDGVWGIPSRNNYRADAGKIRSLLLKLLELSVSQEVTSNEERFANLGVADSSVQEGRVRLTLADGSGKELATAYVGQVRKRNEQARTFGAAGQYFRKGNEKSVYIIPEPITVVPRIGDWLDAIIINVLEGSIVEIQQYQIADGNETLQFELKRAERDPTAPLLPQGFPEGTEFNQSTLSQLINALANLRLNDVLSEKDEAAKEINFNAKTVFKTSSGLVYALQSGSLKDKPYITVRVSFDGSLVKAPAPAQEKRPEDASAEQNEVQVKDKTVPAITPSSADQATQLNERLQLWVYEVPNYAVTKLHFTRNDLLKDGPVEKS